MQETSTVDPAVQHLEQGVGTHNCEEPGTEESVRSEDGVAVCDEQLAVAPLCKSIRFGSPSTAAGILAMLERAAANDQSHLLLDLDYSVEMLATPSFIPPKYEGPFTKTEITEFFHKESTTGEKMLETIATFVHTHNVIDTDGPRERKALAKQVARDLTDARKKMHKVLASAEAIALSAVPRSEVFQAAKPCRPQNRLNKRK